MNDFCNTLIINEGIINILKNIINSADILSKNDELFIRYIQDQILLNNSLYDITDDPTYVIVKTIIII